MVVQSLKRVILTLVTCGGVAIEEQLFQGAHSLTGVFADASFSLVDLLLLFYSSEIKYLNLHYLVSR